uniref:RING-type E3 ubiquitin transferase n=1 Tax=Phasianus colchicus TaxID=9054 RepID=A0A669P2G7_PHACC
MGLGGLPSEGFHTPGQRATVTSLPLAEQYTTAAAPVKESNLSSLVLPASCSEKTMAAEEAWTCSICRDVRQDIAYASPCNHMFCLGCIQRWARLRDSCPLCRTAMKTIRVSVPGSGPLSDFFSQG